MIKRKSLKARPKKGGGENFDKKNVLFEALLLNALVAKRGGGENFDKKKIIESMGCQEGGKRGGGARKILTKRYKKNVVFKSESLKALVAKWGGGRTSF